MGEKWRRTENGLRRPFRSGDLRETWRLLEAAVTSAPRDDDADELEFLYRATQLAAQYGQVRRAVEWIRSHRQVREAKGRLDGPVARAYEVLELGVYWVVKDYKAAGRILHELNWDEVPSKPWAYVIRLSLTVHRNAQNEVLDLLRRPSPVIAAFPAFRDPHHRGNRLRHLGFFFYERGDVRRGLGYFRAALREYRRDASIDSRLKEIEITGHCGRAAFRNGDMGESERHLRRAMRRAARYKHRLWYNTFLIHLAWVHAYRGQYESAERIALRAAENAKRRPGRSGVYHSLRVKCFLAAGNFAASAGNRPAASRYAWRASRLLERRSHPRLPGYLHMLRGRVEALAGDDVSQQRALEEFARAEDCFCAFGDGDVAGLLRLTYYRGGFHIQRRNIRSALGESVRCMEIARSKGFLPAVNTALLLKSQLLLQREVPDADRLYEEVLRDLGSIHNSVVLFKVVANLYHYSWELGDQLELTDWHLQQINGMAELLDKETFRCLYDRYVKNPVIRRALINTRDLDPGLIGGEGAF